MMVEPFDTIIAQTTVRRPRRSEHLAGDAVLQLNLLVLYDHLLDSGRRPRFGRVYVCTCGLLDLAFGVGHLVGGRPRNDWWETREWRKLAIVQRQQNQNFKRTPKVQCGEFCRNLPPGSEKLVLKSVDSEKTKSIAPTTGMNLLTCKAKYGQSMMKNAVQTATSRLSVK